MLHGGIMLISFYGHNFSGLQMIYMIVTFKFMDFWRIHKINVLNKTIKKDSVGILNLWIAIPTKYTKLNA